MVLSLYSSGNSFSPEHSPDSLFNLRNTLFQESATYLVDHSSNLQEFHRPNLLLIHYQPPRFPQFRISHPRRRASTEKSLRLHISNGGRARLRTFCILLFQCEKKRKKFRHVRCCLPVDRLLSNRGAELKRDIMKYASTPEYTSYSNEK